MANIVMAFIVVLSRPDHSAADECLALARVWRTFFLFFCFVWRTLIVVSSEPDHSALPTTHMHSTPLLWPADTFYLGIADGMSVARTWACRYPKCRYSK